MSSHINIGDVDLNAFAKMTDEQREQVCVLLHPLHQYLAHKLEHAPAEKLELVLGLEWVLQGLGAEGYEFT